MAPLRSKLSSAILEQGRELGPSDRLVMQATLNHPVRALHTRGDEFPDYANSEAVQERVAERSLDLGFIEGDSHLPLLVHDLCCEDELRVVCAPTHALAKAASVEPKLLTEHAYISREPGSGTREVVDHYLQKAGLAPDSLQVVMEASSPEALKGMVATGLGFAIMSRVTVAKEVRLGELVEIALSPPLVRQLAVVYPRERFHSRLIEGFLQFAKQRLAALQTADCRGSRAA